MIDAPLTEAGKPGRRGRRHGHGHKEKKMAIVLKLMCWVLFTVIYCRVVVATVRIKLLLEKEMKNNTFELSVWDN
jgi:hypothetical protein